jgi:hypothetical protein
MMLHAPHPSPRKQHHPHEQYDGVQRRNRASSDSSLRSMSLQVYSVDGTRIAVVTVKELQVHTHRHLLYIIHLQEHILSVHSQR